MAQLQADGAFEDPLVQARAGQALAACEAARMLVYRVVDQRARKQPPSAEEGLVARGEQSRVMRAMQTPPTVQRETLEIAFFEGLTYPEIAEREGVPLGTIKSRAARALHALREALEADQV